MTTLTNNSLKTQHGAAVLVVSIILLLAVTMLVMFAVRVGILDQKISGNEYRHKEAFSNAESGLDQAASFLRANPVLHAGEVADGWETCVGSTSIFPCNISGAELVYATVVAGSSITAKLPDTSGNSNSYLVKASDQIMAIGEGQSDDLTGSAIAQVSYAKTTLLTPGEIPPLMMPSGNLNGSFTIVPNPNGGGPGVAISAWVETVGTANGTWQTCDHGDFQDSGVCMDTLSDSDSWSSCSCIDARSDKDNVGDDIVIDPTDFPFSPFAFVFGKNLTSTAEVTAFKEEIKARAADKGKVLDDCSTLDSMNLATDVEMPLIWVTGDCSIPSNSSIGDRTTPIILVVEGDLKVNANGEIWGIIVGGLSDSAGNVSSFTMNGGAVVHGSAISDTGDEILTNGSYSQVYDESVFNALLDDTTNTDIAKIQYSWRDFTP